MNKSIIIVLGMHRSGTSLIARSLGTLGVEFGDNLMPGVIDNNAKGFWEDMDVFALNEEMLATCNSNWWATETIPEKTITNLIESGFQERAVSLIEKKIKNVRFFGLKDPRISKLFKFWSEIFKKVDAEIIYIYSLRNPISIAHSLHNRDGINFFHSYMAWAEHCLTPLAGLENKKWVKIEYEKLIENAEEELKKISLITGLELNQSELANFKDKFIDKKLQHTCFNLEDCEKSENMPDLCKKMFDHLSTNELSSLIPDKSYHQEIFKQWVDEFLDWRLVCRSIDEMAEKNFVLLGTLKVITAEAKQGMAEVEQAREETQQAREETQQAREETQQAREETQQALEETQQAREETQQALEETQQVRLIVKSLTNKIKAIEDSSSWKLSAPFRHLKDQLKGKDHE